MAKKFTADQIRVVLNVLGATETQREEIYETYLYLKKNKIITENIREYLLNAYIMMLKHKGTPTSVYLGD